MPWHTNGPQNSGCRNRRLHENLLPNPLAKENPFIDEHNFEIKPDGQFEFWHNDGDMFYGHSIQISGSLKEGLTDSDIPG